MDTFIIRNAEKSSDLEQIKNLFYTVFYPERVDELAEIFYKHLPNRDEKNWFLAEDKTTGKIVSGFVLIPWQWDFEGISLKVAEMGLVATMPEYRGKGLMKLLNVEFNKTLEEEGYCLAVIQGIPGFYQKFGYHYALPLENHVLVDLKRIDLDAIGSSYSFSDIQFTDIPFLMDQDAVFSRHFSITGVRSQPQWEYLFNHCKKNGNPSEFWIMENKNTQNRYYFRIMLQGFGNGLIVSEVTENISEAAFMELMKFLKVKAIERSKPFIRFNISHQSAIMKFLNTLGAENQKTYGWQIKVPNKISLLEVLRPIFEERILHSKLAGFSGIFRLDFYTHTIDLNWHNGKLKAIATDNEPEVETILSMSDDLFPALCLGHRSWEEIQYIRPDIFPGNLYINPIGGGEQNTSQLLTEILFPKVKAWVNCQY